MKRIFAIAVAAFVAAICVPAALATEPVTPQTPVPPSNITVCGKVKGDTYSTMDPLFVAFLTKALGSVPPGLTVWSGYASQQVLPYSGSGYIADALVDGDTWTFSHNVGDYPGLNGPIPGTLLGLANGACHSIWIAPERTYWLCYGKGRDSIRPIYGAAATRAALANGEWLPYASKTLVSQTKLGDYYFVCDPEGQKPNGLTVSSGGGEVVPGDSSIGAGLLLSNRIDYLIAVA